VVLAGHLPWPLSRRIPLLAGAVPVAPLLPLGTACQLCQPENGAGGGPGSKLGIWLALGLLEVESPGDAVSKPRLAWAASGQNWTAALGKARNLG